MINNKNVTNIELPRMGDVDFGNPHKLYSRYGLCPPTRSQKRPPNRPPAGAFYFTAKWTSRPTPVIGATRRGRSDKGEAAGRHATEGALFDKIAIDRGRSVRRSIRISVRRGE